MATTIQYYCERCPRYLSATEILTIQAPDGRVKVPGCPVCRGHVRGEEQQSVVGLERVVFREAIPPLFHGQNLAALLATTIGAFLFARFGGAPGGGVAVAILLTFAAQTNRAAADPHSGGALGQAFDFTSWGAVTGPILRRLFVLAISVAPLVASAFVEPPEAAAALALAGALFYVLYTPAALIVAARATVAATVFSPIAPFRVAFRVGGDYFMLAALHLAATVVGGAIVAGVFSGASALEHVLPIFPTFVAWGVLVVVTAAQARVLGLAVREHRHVLGLDP